MSSPIEQVPVSDGDRRRSWWDRARRRVRRGRQAERGMTLIEIMVVVSIIGLIMGAVGVVAFNRYKRAQIKNAEMVLKNVESAVEMFMMDNNGDCPKDLSELREQKILSKEAKDPWGRLLAFKCPGEHNPDGVDLSSGGADKKEGTEDDITNW